MNLLKRVIGEPLVQFVLLGALLFGLYAHLSPGAGATPASHRIQLSMDELAQMVIVFRSQWRRDPTPQEIDAMVEDQVQQEVLYREALAMGLDKDDEIVKRRMAQKMKFLAEDVAAAREPTTAELREWFGKHAAEFALPSRYSFRHLYFSTDKRGARARDDAAAALRQLSGQKEDAPLAATVADPFMFQDYYRDRATDYLGKEFGPQFAEAVTRLPVGSWQGPVESGFGWHLVYVDTVIPGRIPDFEEVEPDVKLAWLGEQKANAWQKAYADMRAKYVVLLPAPPQDAKATR
ncbi:MAG: peptidylprolyl isomerase [Steroidobacteraceae bacterium]